MPRYRLQVTLLCLAKYLCFTDEIVKLAKPVGTTVRICIFFNDALLYFSIICLFLYSSAKFQVTKISLSQRVIPHSTRYYSVV